MRGLLPLALAASASAVALRPPPNGTRRVHRVRRAATWRPTYDLPERFAEMWGGEDALGASGQKHLDVTGVKEFAPHGPGIKLVVGIPVLLSQGTVYEAHLQTWVRGEGVCQLKDYSQPNCSVFPVFLLGNSTDAQARAGNASAFALSLPVPEPDMSNDDGYLHPSADKRRNLGKDADAVVFLKPYLWFRFAGENYKWATHLGKMDADTYPHFRHVLADLAEGPPDNLYWGTHMGGRNMECKRGFMQGGMYIISAALQACMQPVADAVCPEAEFDFARWHICPWQWGEDDFFGTCLFHASEKGKCPPLSCMNARQRNRYIHPCCGGKRK